MPTNRRRRLQPRRGTNGDGDPFDTPRVWHRLGTGEDNTDLAGPRLAEDELAEAWEHLGERLLDAWINKVSLPRLLWRHRGGPLTRPWGWWMFAAKCSPPANQREYLRAHGLLTEREREIFG